MSQSYPGVSKKHLQKNPQKQKILKKASYWKIIIKTDNLKIELIGYFNTISLNIPSATSCLLFCFFPIKY